MQRAALRGQDVVAVDLAHAHAAEDCRQLVAVPGQALDHHHQAAAHLQAVEALFDEPLGHGKVRVVGRIGENPVKAGRIHGLQRVALHDAHARNAVARRVLPRAGHGCGVHIRQDHGALAQDHCRRNAHKARAAPQVQERLAGQELHLRGHGQRAPVRSGRGEELRRRLDADALGKEFRLVHVPFLRKRGRIFRAPV